jgi:hypothetical protein
MIRYKINPQIKRMDLIKKICLKKPEQAELTPVIFDHTCYIYLCDILETKGNYGVLKLKIFVPNQEPVIGWQSSSVVILHKADELMDGRFNSSGG